MVQHAVCEIDYSLDSHSSSRFKIRKKMQQLEKPKKKMLEQSYITEETGNRK